MIAHLDGTLSHSDEGSVVIDVGGVGYLVSVTEETRRALSGEAGGVRLFTYLAVRENALDLYGFPSRDEVTFFGLLISVPGIGPRSALAIMNLENTETLSKAIARGDSSYLTKVSGVGKKSAEKIVVELREKMLGFSNSDGAESEDTETIDALRSLGYSVKEARDALRLVAPSITGTGDRLKEALKMLGTK